MLDAFKNPQKRKQSWGWWVLLVAVLAVAMFVFGQGGYPSVSAPTPNAPAAASPAPAGDAATGSGELLPGYSAEDDPFPASQPQDERPLWQIALDVAWKFALVLGLLYATLLGLRWLQKNKLGQAATGTTIQVLETVGLAPGRSLHLVVVGEKTLLLGATDHQVALLTELQPEAAPLPADTPADDEMAERVLVSPSPPEAGASFADALAAKIDDQEAVTYHPHRQQTKATLDDWQSTLSAIQRDMQQMKDAAGDDDE